MMIDFTITIRDAYLLRRRLDIKARNEEQALDIARNKYPKCAILDIESSQRGWQVR